MKLHFFSDASFETNDEKTSLFEFFSFMVAIKNYSHQLHRESYNSKLSTRLILEIENMAYTGVFAMLFTHLHDLEQMTSSKTFHTYDA